MLKIVIFLIFLVIFLISTFLIGKNISDYEINAKEIKKLYGKVIQETEDKNKIFINWQELNSINSNIIGWIQIKNTNINYPILKDKNLFYLNHTYKQTYNNHGAIFTTNLNPFEDKETIIYGHNMKDGTMFSELSKYLDSSFFQEHNTFKIYTTTQNYECTIFSAYSIGIEDEEKNIKGLDFQNKIEYYKKSSNFYIKDIGKIEKIVKLSTCSYLNNRKNPTNQRYYIIAKLVNVK